MSDHINDEGLKIPNHVAMILDGNGRWAKKRFLPRTAGHAQGAKNVVTMGEKAYDMGIKYFTVYAFSTENWKRANEEVSKLMELLYKFVTEHIKKCIKNNMKFRVIGDISRLSPVLQDKINELLEVSKNCTGLNFTVALNYGGRDEILRAFKKFHNDIKDGKKSIDDLDEDCFSKYLDTCELPDPDLLIRPGGEQRLSNYLLWQLSYAEFYFTDVLWPDFTEKDLKDAIVYYNTKERRYGDAK